MANKIILKKSSVANKQPTLEDLDYGELALNYADKKLYFKTSSNTISSFSTGAGASISTSDTPPESPTAGDLWLNSSDLSLFAYYDDGTSQQWVSISGPQGPEGDVGPQGVGVPVGGTTGQVLTKLGTEDYNTSWTTPVSSESPAFTGAIALMGSVRQGVLPIEALEINCASGNYFTKTITSATAFTVANVPTGAYFLTLRLTNGGSATITWPQAFKWPGGIAPQLTQSGVDLIVAVTDDGGTTWRAGALKDIK